MQQRAALVDGIGGASASAAARGDGALAKEAAAAEVGRAIGTHGSGALVTRQRFSPCVVARSACVWVRKPGNERVFVEIEHHIAQAVGAELLEALVEGVMLLLCQRTTDPSLELMSERL